LCSFAENFYQVLLQTTGHDVVETERQREQPLYDE